MARLEEEIKRPLVIVAHQDDEILFFGGLLSNLQGHVEDMMIVNVYEPAKGRKDTNTRLNAFSKMAEYLGAKGVCLCVEDVRPLSYKDYYSSCTMLLGIIYGFSPDVIITHNHMGDYGHSQHREVNEMVREITTNANPHMNMPRVLATVVGLEKEPDYLVKYDKKKKGKLFSFYSPQWDPKSYKFAYEPEGYIQAFP